MGLLLRKLRCLFYLCGGKDLTLASEKRVEINVKKNKNPERFTVYSVKCRYCNREITPEVFTWREGI